MKICIDCEVEKPLDQYSVNSRRKDGHASRCKPCESIYNRAARDRRAKAPVIISVTEKLCTDCRETKPLEDFPSRRDAADRRYTYCRSCTSRRNADQLQRRKSGELPTATPAEKACGACGEIKPAEDFWKANKSADGLAWYCKSCTRSYARMRSYGVSEEWMTKKFEEQEGRCAICPSPIAKDSCHVDHDHETGAVRDLLCAFCNKGLGHFRDDLELLIAAAEYLERHRTVP